MQPTGKYVLVYQGGLANVFEVAAFTRSPKGRDTAKRLQRDFDACRWFCLGIQDMGGEIRVAYCNEAGDITHREWNTKREDAPFSSEFTTDFKPL